MTAGRIALCDTPGKFVFLICRLRYEIVEFELEYLRPATNCNRKRSFWERPGEYMDLPMYGHIWVDITARLGGYYTDYFKLKDYCWSKVGHDFWGNGANCEAAPREQFTASLYLYVFWVCNKG